MLRKQSRTQTRHEVLVGQFLSEVLAVVKRERTRNAASDALRKGYFAELRQYQQWGDFQFKDTLQRPRPLELYIDPYTLYGYFRLWLRKHGLDPDTIEPT